MKRFFSFLLLVSLSTSLVFADAYHDALVKYLGGTQENLSQVKQSLGAAMQTAFPDNPDKAAQVMTEYFTTQGIEDLADIYEPAFRKYVSLEDLNELQKLYSDPRYAEMSKRSTKMAAEIAQSPELAQFTNQLTTSMQTIMAGGTPEPIPVSASVTEDYQKLFHKYYIESQIGETMNEAYKPIVGMIESSLTNNGVKNAKSIATSVFTYISSNMETVFLNIFNKAFTQDDLNLLIEAASKPAQKNAMKATTEIVSDPFSFISGFLTKMSAWLQVHYPDYAEPFNKALQEIPQR